MVYQHLKPIEILLVEDNRGDAFLMVEVLGESSIDNIVHVVVDGEEALDYLHHRGMHTGAHRPDLIFLDLNLPKRDGRDVLAEIKADEDLKLIPVVVLTTSESEQDVVKCYHLGANCYVIKPMGLEELFEVVKRIEAFWFSIVRLPARKAIGRKP